MLRAVALLVALQAGGDPPPELIVEGRIFTASLEEPWVEALAVRDGRIVSAGAREGILALRGEGTRVLSAGEGVVVPGFNDAHGHFSVAFGLEEDVDLSGARDLDELLGLLRAYVEAHPEDELVTGGGWSLTRLPEQRFPAAGVLDAAVSDRPVLLWSEGPHAVWANGAALEKARIDADSQPPRGAIIVRDAEGNPTGVFVGRGLLGIFRFLPFPDLGELREGIDRGLVEARKLGVTGVQEQVSPFLLPHLAELADRGELTLRFHVWGGLFPGPFGGGLDDHLGQAQKYGRADWITFGTLKAGLDGMPSLRTAALLEPYADDATTSGLAPVDTERLRTAVREANAKGVRVALHATGDAAVRQALEAFAGASETGLRNRIEHAFLVARADLPRFAASGTIASVQPGFLARDLADDLYARRFGAERCAGVMPLRSLLDAGAVLAFGTDFDLTPLDPRSALAAATTRRTPAGQPAAAFVPAERITLEEAVRAYTLGSALAEGAEARKGRLVPGMLADLVVWSKDPFAAPEALSGVEVVATVVGGRVVFER